MVNKMELDEDGANAKGYSMYLCVDAWNDMA